MAIRTPSTHSWGALGGNSRGECGESETAQPFTFENCLHTYFTVGDITAVSVTERNSMPCTIRHGLVSHLS